MAQFFFFNEQSRWLITLEKRMRKIKNEVSNLEMNGVEVYLVGGAVRDAYLGLKPKDLDWVVVGASHDMMVDAGFTLVPAAVFPVYLCSEGEEYALARTEVKTGQGDKGFEINAEGVTLIEDLGRREAPMCAMAQKSDGTIIDVYGGREDLDNKVYRIIDRNAFKEDAVRITRAARFAAKYGLTLDPEAVEVMREMVEDGLLTMENLSSRVALSLRDRFFREMCKAFKTDKPSRFFEVLSEIGALEVLLPQVHAFHGQTQPEKWHPEGDVFEHVMQCLDVGASLGCSEKEMFAILCHDLGKGLTPKEELPKHIGHEKSGVPVTEEVCNLLNVPKDFKKLALIVTEYHLKVYTVKKPGKIHDLVAICSSDLEDMEIHDVVAKCSHSFKDVEFLRSVMSCSMADQMGRRKDRAGPFPTKAVDLDFYEEVFHVCKAVKFDPKKWPDKKGPAIADWVRQLRIQAMGAL
jgi:tRNA nucleotidyltransferase (CCA-adding enzyme)